jgi:hypothetical protein
LPIGLLLAAACATGAVLAAWVVFVPTSEDAASSWSAAERPVALPSRDLPAEGSSVHPSVPQQPAEAPPPSDPGTVEDPASPDLEIMSRQLRQRAIEEFHTAEWARGIELLERAESVAPSGALRLELRVHLVVARVLRGDPVKAGEALTSLVHEAAEFRESADPDGAVETRSLTWQPLRTQERLADPRTSLGMSYRMWSRDMGVTGVKNAIADLVARVRATVLPPLVRMRGAEVLARRLEVTASFLEIDGRVAFPSSAPGAREALQRDIARFSAEHANDPDPWVRTYSTYLRRFWPEVFGR